MTAFNVEEVRFWCRRDTAANWTSVNPILASGEWGVETDNTGATPRKFKMGDGVTAWASLPYSHPSAFIVQTVTNGDTTHAPSGDAVFDAIAAEAAARASGDAALQPLDSDLTAIAALAPTDDDFIQRKAGAWTNRTMAQLAADLAAFVSQGVPTVLSANFTVAANTQVLFTLPIEVGTYDLDIAGDFVEVA